MCQQWISVEDRLPKQINEVHGSDEVLICYRGSDAMDVGWHVGGKWRVMRDEQVPDGVVTHWMPLPEPPQQ